MRQASVLLVLSLLVLLGAVVSAQVTTPAPNLPDLKPSKDWREVEVQVPTSVTARAWSDPAAGCHLVLFALPIQDSAGRDKIASSLTSVLAKSDYQLTKQDGKAQDRFSLEGFGVQGLATLDIPQGQGRTATLLACYWNNREPAHCSAMCDEAMQGKP
jgi:hypothetical protein